MESHLIPRYAHFGFPKITHVRRQHRSHSLICLIWFTRDVCYLLTSLLSSFSMSMWAILGVDCVKENYKLVSGSLMVCSEIVHSMKIPLMVIQGHRTNVKNNVRRMLLRKVSHSFPSIDNVPVLYWPPYSPNVSLVKHLWEELDIRIWRNVSASRTSLQEWNNISSKEPYTSVWGHR